MSLDFKAIEVYFKSSVCVSKSLISRPFMSSNAAAILLSETRVLAFFQLSSDPSILLEPNSELICFLRLVETVEQMVSLNGQLPLSHGALKLYACG